MCDKTFVCCARLTAIAAAFLSFSLHEISVGNFDIKVKGNFLLESQSIFVCQVVLSIHDGDGDDDYDDDGDDGGGDDDDYDYYC